MPNEIAYIISGTLETLSPLSIGMDDIYPLGQQLRGAFGYIFLDMKLEKLIESYKNANPVLYYRDAFVKHACSEKKNGLLMPILKQNTKQITKRKTKVVYKCSGCGVQAEMAGIKKDKMLGIHLRENGSSRSYIIDIIPEKIKFGFSVVLKIRNDERFLNEFLSAIEFIKDNGLYMGKRKLKGLGKVAVKDIEIKGISMKDIGKRSDQIFEKVNNEKGKIKIWLLSDTIFDKGIITGEDLNRDIKNSCKFFDPHWPEYGGDWKEPKITPSGKHLVSNGKKIVFLDNKVEDGLESPKFNKVDEPISKGTIYAYQIERFKSLSSEFFNGVAMAEMLRGLGDRTSFGKGQFTII